MTLRFQSTRPSAALLMATLGLGLPRSPARAEDAIAYKYETYREADGRIKVETQSGSAEQDFGADTQLKLTGTIDAIAGATPTGEPAPPGSDQVAMTQMHDRRKAWSGDLSHQFPRLNGRRRSGQQPRERLCLHRRIGEHADRFQPEEHHAARSASPARTTT
jgi:hypothetical protein